MRNCFSLGKASPNLAIQGLVKEAYLVITAASDSIIMSLSVEMAMLGPAMFVIAVCVCLIVLRGVQRRADEVWLSMLSIPSTLVLAMSMMAEHRLEQLKHLNDSEDDDEDDLDDDSNDGQEANDGEEVPIHGEDTVPGEEAVKELVKQADMTGDLDWAAVFRLGVNASSSRRQSVTELKLHSSASRTCGDGTCKRACFRSPPAAQTATSSAPPLRPYRKGRCSRVHVLLQFIPAVLLLAYAMAKYALTMDALGDAKQCVGAAALNAMRNEYAQDLISLTMYNSMSSS